MNVTKRLLVSLLCLSVVILGILSLTACKVDCLHEWGDWTVKTESTCTDAGIRERVCDKCGEAETEELSAGGHSYADATCSLAKTCTRCGATEGSPLEHEWEDATCIAPKSCARCDATVGEALGEIGHSGGTATCLDRAECEHCGARYGELTSHNWEMLDTGVAVGCLESGAVKYKCTICLETKTETVAAKGHTFVDAVTAPKCLDGGYTTHTCSVCEYSYVDSETAPIGHSWDKDAVSCTEGRECTVCDAQEEAPGHKFDSHAVTEPTCDTDGYTTHTCSVCSYSYKDTAVPALGHDITGVDATEEAAEGNPCAFVQVYVCKTCEDEVIGETVYHHSYKAAITTAATCSTDGIKTLTCQSCQDTKTEVIEKNATGHDWLIGETVGVKRTDACSLCSETRQVTVVEGNTTPSTNAGDLKDTEIEMDDANISLDGGVIDSIGNVDIVISADKLVGDDRPDAGLSEDQLAQIGDSPVYNFTMQGTDGNISQFGENNWVTITIPYELSPGEDVDNIAIWFITDEGELESFRATYNNGFVSFKTNHFSYYTVTRLTPAERCALYGHNYVTATVDVTCTTDGYDIHACIRCADTYRDNIIVAEGHKHEAVTTPAGCLTTGRVVYTCACGHAYETIIPALGHEWELEEHVDATCTDRGYDKYGCTRCDREYTDAIAKLRHSMSESVVAATCESYGYTLHACATCDYSYMDNTVAAIGHVWTYAWSWADDYSGASLVFTCTNDSAHTHTVTATVTEKTIIGTVEKIEYYARAINNGEVFNDTKVVVLGEHTHSYNKVNYDDKNHWAECVCGDKQGSTAHVFADGEITKAPTCGADGERAVVCECGKSSVKAVPPTGNHTWGDDKICDVCGTEKKADFYLNLVSSPFNTDGVTIKLSDFSYVVTEERNNGDIELVGSITQTDIAELVINYVDGELFMTAH
jgi:hypothetical protein